MFLGGAVVRPPDGLRMLFGVPEAFTGTCSITLRRAVALELGGFEDQFRDLFEDQVFLTKVYAERSVLALQECLALYRMHPGSTCARRLADVTGTRGAYFEAMRRLRDWLVQYLLPRSCWLTDVSAALQHLSEGARDPSAAWVVARRLLAGERLDRVLISATELRARMSRGASVRYLLPEAVVDYIAAHRLYGVQ